MEQHPSALQRSQILFRIPRHPPFRSSAYSGTRHRSFEGVVSPTTGRIRRQVVWRASSIQAVAPRCGREFDVLFLVGRRDGLGLGAMRDRHLGTQNRGEWR